MFKVAWCYCFTLQTIVVELEVSINSESEAEKIEKAVSSLEGVKSVSTKKDIGRLFVRGHFDPQAVTTRVREFEKTVQVKGVSFPWA